MFARSAPIRLCVTARSASCRHGADGACLLYIVKPLFPAHGIVVRLHSPMGKECLTISLQSRFVEERNNRETTLTRKEWRDVLYAFARPLVPLWDESELYEAVDNFLDSTEL